MLLPSIVFCTDGSDECCDLLSAIQRNEKCSKIEIKASNFFQAGDLLDAEHPVGVILPITPQIIEAPDFTDCVQNIVNRMDNVVGTSFRCYIYPIGMSYEQFRARCDKECENRRKRVEYNEGLYQIQEHIHHAPFDGISDLCDELWEFANNTDFIANYYNCMKIKTTNNRC